MSLLDIRNVSKIYGELKALDNVSIRVDQGEWASRMYFFAKGAKSKR